LLGVDSDRRNAYLNNGSYNWEVPVLINENSEEDAEENGFIDTFLT